MDELRMFLENDAWELCPVKASFKIVDLSVSNKGNWLFQSGDAFRLSNCLSEKGFLPLCLFLEDP